MKWIGQHIYDNISRFRSDVYLEDIATGTIASGGNLGLDSNNKIVKASASGGIAFDGSTANGVLTYKDSDEAAVESNLTFDGTDLTVASTGKVKFRDANSYIYSNDSNDLEIVATDITLDAAGDIDLQVGGGELDCDATTVSFNSTSSGFPIINIKNQADNTLGGYLKFVKQRVDSITQIGEDNDFIGTIGFESYDDGGTPGISSFAQIYAQIHDATAGEESGKLSLAVANHDGGAGVGLTLTGGSADNEVDVSVGLGVSSVTTIAGDLTVTSDLTVGGDTITFESANADDPQVIIKNTTADNQGARLQFHKDRGAAMVDNDRIGEIDFIGEDAAQNSQQYGKIFVQAKETDHGSETGMMKFQVAEYDGTNSNGLVLTGQDADGEVDVDIGLGAASTTTIAGTLTMGSTAAMTNAGLLSVANQSNITGVGTISSGTWQGTSIATTYTAAKVTSIVAGDGIDVSGATGDVTVTAETATDSNPGVVELATTGEADTGTDTARAVTPAGLKSHVDARYASSYITFLGQATMLSSGNWVLSNKTGISNHTWNQDSAINTETNDSTQATIARQWAHTGIRMPAACVIAGMSCMISNAGGNRQVTVGLFCSRATDSTLPDWGGNSGASPKLQMHADANNESGNYSGRPAHAEATGTVAMAAGDIFYPGIKLTGVTSGGNTDNVYASFTVHIKTLIS